jgi:hypothetical protein
MIYTLLGFLLALIFVCVILFIIPGLILMLFWNWLVPGLSNGPEISLLQGMGIIGLLYFIGSFFRK